MNGRSEASVPVTRRFLTSRPVRTTAGAAGIGLALLLLLLAAVATTVALALAWLLPMAAPAVQISITAANVAQTTTTALLVGMIAALWPLRRIAALDAATAFRETR